MEIYLIRHAAAVPRGDSTLDHARPLTARGRRRFIEAVRGLDRLGVRLDHAYHSPWIRAVQTAELLSPVLDGERIALEALAGPPGVPLLEALRGGRIALVGHEPWMGQLCSLITGGDADGGLRFPFKKGGVAHLTGIPTPGGGEVVALYPPKALRLLARK